MLENDVCVGLHCRISESLQCQKHMVRDLTRLGQSPGELIANYYNLQVCGLKRMKHVVEEDESLVEEHESAVAKMNQFVLEGESFGRSICRILKSFGWRRFVGF